MTLPEPRTTPQQSQLTPTSPEAPADKHISRHPHTAHRTKQDRQPSMPSARELGPSEDSHRAEDMRAAAAIVALKGDKRDGCGAGGAVDARNTRAPSVARSNQGDDAGSADPSPRGEEAAPRAPAPAPDPARASAQRGTPAAAGAAEAPANVDAANPARGKRSRAQLEDVKYPEFPPDGIVERARANKWRYDVTNRTGRSTGGGSAEQSAGLRSRSDAPAAAPASQRSSETKERLAEGSRRSLPDLSSSKNTQQLDRQSPFHRQHFEGQPRSLPKLNPLPVSSVSPGGKASPGTAAPISMERSSLRAAFDGGERSTAANGEGDVGARGKEAWQPFENAESRKLRRLSEPRGGQQEAENAGRLSSGETLKAAKTEDASVIVIDDGKPWAGSAVAFKSGGGSLSTERPPVGRSSHRPKRPKRASTSAKRWASPVDAFRRSPHLPRVETYLEDRRQVPFRDMRGWIDKLAAKNNVELVKIWDTLLDSLIPEDTANGGDEDICRFVLGHVVTDQVDPENPNIRQTRQAVNNAIKRELECPAELNNQARGYTFRDLFRRKCRERARAGKPELPLAPPVVAPKSSNSAPLAPGLAPPAPQPLSRADHGPSQALKNTPPLAAGESGYPRYAGSVVSGVPEQAVHFPFPSSGARGTDDRACVPSLGSDRSGEGRLGAHSTALGPLGSSISSGPQADGSGVQAPSSSRPSAPSEGVAGGAPGPEYRAAPASPAGKPKRDSVLIQRMYKLLLVSEMNFRVPLNASSAMCGGMPWWLLVKERKEDPSQLFNVLLGTRRYDILLQLLFDFRWIRAFVFWPGWESVAKGLSKLAFDAFQRLLNILRSPSPEDGLRDVPVYEEFGFEASSLESLRLTHIALTMIMPVFEMKIIEHEQDHLATQLYGRLMGRRMRLVNRLPHLGILLHTIRKYASDAGPWLRPLNSVGFDEPMTDLVATMSADESSVVSISEDGNFVAVAGGPKSRVRSSTCASDESTNYPIYVWHIVEEAETGPDKQLRVLNRAHDREINCLEISPNGAYMISSAVQKKAGAIKLWADWKPKSAGAILRDSKYDLPEQESVVVCLVISADSKTLAVAFQDGCIKTWLISENQQPVQDRNIATSIGEDFFMRGLAMSADNLYFAYLIDKNYSADWTNSARNAVPPDDATLVASTHVWSFGESKGQERLIERLPDVGRQSEGAQQSSSDLGPASKGAPGTDRPRVLSIAFLYSDNCNICVATAGSENRHSVDKGFIRIWGIARAKPFIQYGWTATCWTSLPAGNMGTVSSLACPPCSENSGTSINILFASINDGLVLAWQRKEENSNVQGPNSTLPRSKAEEIAKLWFDVTPVPIGVGGRLGTEDWSVRPPQEHSGLVASPVASPESLAGISRSEAASERKKRVLDGPVTTHVSLSRNAEKVAMVSWDRAFVRVWDVGVFLKRTLPLWRAEGIYKTLKPPTLLGPPTSSDPTYLDDLENKSKLSDYFRKHSGFDAMPKHERTLPAGISSCVPVSLERYFGKHFPQNRTTGWPSHDNDTLILCFDKSVARIDSFDGGLIASGLFKFDDAERPLRSQLSEERNCPRLGLALRFADEQVAFFELEGWTSPDGDAALNGHGGRRNRRGGENPFAGSGSFSGSGQGRGYSEGTVGPLDGSSAPG